LKKLFITGLLLLIQVIYLKGQEPAKNWTVDLSGFINAQVFLDTRKNVEARAGMFTLYPLKHQYDASGRDINEKVSFNQASMTTRVRANVKAPEIWGAALTGAVEVDFTGVSNQDLNGLRLREAWINLNWKSTALLFGQYWHPLCIPEAMPKTISLNLGAPYHPFSRHNQIRVQQSIGRFEIIGVAAMQLDYASEGPIGRSPVYMINAAIPNFDLQLHYQTKDGQLIGIGADYKQLLPRLSLELIPGHISRAKEKIHSFAGTLFMKLTSNICDFRWQLLWGQNMTEHIMLGGYIESKVDSTKNRINYANTEQLSTWFDLVTKGKTLRAGLFVGAARNLGYGDAIEGVYYSRGNDIEYTFRISPRLQFHFNKLMLASEFEYTAAAYGNPDPIGNIADSEMVANFRLLLAVFYFF
jgi:hypothetical protein